MDNGNREKFDKFLAWLHPDRDPAAARYATIRNGLVKFFSRRTRHGDYSCPHAEELADETLDRVISKMDEIELPSDIIPEARIHAFAKFVRLEHLRQPQPEPLPPDVIDYPDVRIEEAGEKERHLHCHDQCVGPLPKKDRRIITEYFQYTGQERIQRRRQLAGEMDITIINLRTTACRLREKMEECLRNCLEK